MTSAEDFARDLQSVLEEEARQIHPINTTYLVLTPKMDKPVQIVANGRKDREQQMKDFFGIDVEDETVQWAACPIGSRSPKPIGTDEFLKDRLRAALDIQHQLIAH